MPLELPGLFQRAADTAKGLLGAAPGVAADVAAEYIRTGGPPSVIPNLGVAAARGACRLYGGNPGGAPDAIAPALEAVCRPYLNDLAPGRGVGVGFPFDGGQCATLYVVFATNNGVDLNIGGQTPLNILGPLSAPTFTQTVVGSPFPDSTRYAWTFPSDPGKVVQFVARSTFTPNPGFRVAGRVDGGPDNCGNPEPVIRRPVPIPEPGPFPFPFNPGPDIDIDIDVDFSPTGVDIDFGIGPINIDLGGGSDEGPGGGREPGDIGEPGGATDIGEGSDGEGEAPPGKVIGALLLTITNEPPRFKEVAPGVFRGACYVYMGTSVGLDLDPAGGLVRSPQIVFPELPNLTHWAVQVNRGFDIRVTPYYIDATE